MLKSNEDTVKSGDEKTLPPLEKGQVFENVTSSVIEHYTSPPKPYTDVICYERGIRNRP